MSLDNCRLILLFLVKCVNTEKHTVVSTIFSVSRSVWISVDTGVVGTKFICSQIPILRPLREISHWSLSTAYCMAATVMSIITVDVFAQLMTLGT